MVPERARLVNAVDRKRAEEKNRDSDEAQTTLPNHAFPADTWPWRRAEEIFFQQKPTISVTFEKFQERADIEKTAI